MRPRGERRDVRRSPAELGAGRSQAQTRFHAVTTPRVPLRPFASQSVPYRRPPPAVPHQAKRRKRPVFSLFFAVLAMAPPARIELATLALGKPCSIQLSYGGGRRRLSRPWTMLKLCRGLRYILRSRVCSRRVGGGSLDRGAWRDPTPTLADARLRVGQSPLLCTAFATPRPPAHPT